MPPADWVDAVSDERQVAEVRACRCEVERRLRDVLAALGFDQAIERVEGVLRDRLDALAAANHSLERAVLDARRIADRIVRVAKVLHHGEVAKQL
ncbi:MAG TPA: hypothetical protein VI299_03450 [Polyangiales bacterium]